MKNNKIELPKNLSINGFQKDNVIEDWGIDNINKLRLFIKGNLDKTKNFNRQSTSYGLKHKIERKTDLYVSNGELIAAMILEGYKWDIDWSGINCNFNVSKKSVKKLDKYV